MKKPIGYQALYATSLLAFAISGTAHAELKAIKQQAIVEDAITPEAPEAAQEEVVVVKKAKPRTLVAATPVEEVVSQNTNNNVNNNSAQAIAISAPPAEKPSMGSQLDAGIKTKMEDVQTQFETALLKTLDRIKITVDDGAPVQGANGPTQAVVVQDNLVNTQGAADKSDYMSVDDAPKVDDEDKQDDADVASKDGSTVATLEKASFLRKVSISPVFGKTMIGSDYYNINSRYTAGFELEFDIDRSFAIELGYAYSQYDVGLASANPIYGQPIGFGGLNLQTLQYNQNLFSATGRIYLMPRPAKFRVFVGGGTGYNLGYLNYNQNNSNGYLSNPYYSNYNTSDYAVKSWLGIAEAGSTFSVSDSVSLGALFKYAFVFSSTQNAPLNNYAFLASPYGSNVTPQQAAVGGSLASENFYSILGTVKVSF